MKKYNFYVVNRNDENDKTFLGSRPEHRVDRFLDALEDRFNDDYKIVIEESEGE